MRKCIWCLREDKEVEFRTKAHTIPKGLGGIVFCDNVCDNCNSHFGNKQKGYPSIEAILKETFNLSRTILLNGRMPPNNKRWRYTSEYFNVHAKNKSLEIKQKYSLKKGFQSEVCRLLKRGLFKIFLEENERIHGTSFDDKYDFIREFARYDLGDYPVFYFQREIGLILSGDDLIAAPHLMFSEPLFTYLIRDFNYYEFEFFGHVLSLPTSRNWQLSFDAYVKQSFAEKNKFFNGGLFSRFVMIKHWNDIDLPLSVFKE